MVLFRSPQIDKPVYRWACKPVCTTPTTCGSWLACDESTSVCQKYRGDAIAGKPGSHTGLMLLLDHDKSTNRFTGVPASPSARHRPPVGAGLPAMNSPRYIRSIEAMPSRASPAPTQAGSDTLARSRTNRQAGLPVACKPVCTTPTPCGSWLACDEFTSVLQKYRGDAIAGKPGSHTSQVRNAGWITNKSTNRFTGMPASPSARHRPPVGAGLPANSPRSSRSIEAMPSRASPAPTQAGSDTLARSRINRQTGLPVWLQAVPGLCTRQKSRRCAAR